MDQIHEFTSYRRLQKSPRRPKSYPGWPEPKAGPKKPRMDTNRHEFVSIGVHSWFNIASISRAISAQLGLGKI